MFKLSWSNRVLHSPRYIALAHELGPSLVSVESAVLTPCAPKVVFDYVQEVMRQWCPQLASRVSTMDVEERNLSNVVICFDHGLHQMFMSRVSGELPFGKRCGSTVLDLVVNFHRW